MRTRATVSILLLLSLLVPIPALVPAAAAQEGGAPPQGAPPQGAAADEEGPQPEATYPGAAQIETIPANAIVLSLNETIRQAIENNIGIAVKRYDPISSATFVTNYQSAFDPTLTGSAQKSKLQDGTPSAYLQSQDSKYYAASFLDPLTIGGSYKIDVSASDSSVVTPITPSGEPQYVTNWKLTYIQPLLRNLGRQANMWQIVVAQDTLGITEAGFKQTVIDTITSAVKAYADLNFAIMQLRTARFSLKLAQDFLEQNKIKVRVGTLAPIEITQAEAQVADREEQVIIFEGALRAAEDQLRQAIGMRKDSTDWSRPVRPSDPLTLKEYSPTEEAAMEAAMVNRPDLVQARLNTDSKETTLKARQNERRWALDFQGTYGNQGFSQDGYSDSYHDLRDRTQVSWTLGLGLSVPIGNRNALANYNRAESELGQARFQTQQIEQNVRLDIRAAVRDVETTLKRVKSAQTNVRLQKEKLDAEQKKFENGMSTSFQVLSFQNDLSAAETRKNLAIADYNKALADVERAKGTILDYFGIVLKGTQDAQPDPAASAALRNWWRRPADYISDPGLRLAERAAAGVRLPSDFTLVDGRATRAGAATAVPEWVTGDTAADAGTGDVASAGGR
jgi:outer membrane protein